MAIEVLRDTLRTLSFREVGGMLTEVTTSLYVTGESSPGLNVWGQSGSVNASNVQDVLNAIDAAGHEPGHRFSLDPSHRSLFCDSRNVTFQSPGRASAILHYRRINRSMFGNAYTPMLYIPSNTMKTVGTNRLPDGSSVDVEYGGKVQAAEFSVKIPERGFKMEIVGEWGEDYPERVCKEWHGKLNQHMVWESERGTVMCTGADWRPLDFRNPQLLTGGAKHKVVYTFEFKRDPRGWNPWASWRDAGQGRELGSLAKGTPAEIRVDWYPEIDFVALDPGIDVTT